MPRPSNICQETTDTLLLRPLSGCTSAPPSSQIYPWLLNVAFVGVGWVINKVFFEWKTTLKFPQSVSVAAVCWISSPRGGAAWCRLFSLLISITTSRLLSASERAQQREGGGWLLVADLSIRSITAPKASLAIITPRAPPIIGARKAASCMMIHWQTWHRGTPALVNEAIFSCVPC